MGLISASSDIRGHIAFIYVELGTLTVFAPLYYSNQSGGKGAKCINCHSLQLLPVILAASLSSALLALI